MAIGDVFIQGGTPGHAMLVVDLAANVAGERVFLLAQGFMPAQEMHIVKNPAAPGLSPWFALTGAGELTTPSWPFQWTHLRSFEKRKGTPLPPPAPGTPAAAAKPVFATVAATLATLRVKADGGPVFVCTFTVVRVASGTFAPPTVTLAVSYYGGGEGLLKALNIDTGDGLGPTPTGPPDKTREVFLTVNPPSKAKPEDVEKFGINADLVIWKLQE